MSPAELLAEAARTDSARPLVTSYDETRGERTELSVATVVNWVAKLGNALADEWGLDAGDEVAVDLPAHWSGAVAALAVWSAGGEVVDGEAAAAFLIRTGDAAALTDRELVLTLAPMGMDLSGLVAGWPDVPAGVVPPGGAGAVRSAAGLALPARVRLLSTVPFRTSAAAAACLVAPLAAGGSLVVVRGEAAPERLAAIAGIERVTYTAGCDLPGCGRLSVF